MRPVHGWSSNSNFADGGLRTIGVVDVSVLSVSAAAVGAGEGGALTALTENNSLAYAPP